MTLGSAYREIYEATGPAGEASSIAPADWQSWLAVLFGQYVASGFADRHVAFWEWVWSIALDSKPDPFVGVWPRGGGKTTSAELATASLGARDKRKYALYVRGTQDRADDSVANVARMFEAPTIAEYYPQHADRDVNKFGNSRGWRRNRIRTAGGFTVDAIGLDVAARGVKLDEQRPDLIVFDDIDEKLDTAATTQKKIATLTTSLLPAGASNVAVLAIQNLIIPDGIFTRLVDGRADFLAKRIVSGPFPAVRDLEVEAEPDPESGVKRYVIVAGEATWAGQNIATCQAQIDEWGYSAFRKEAQHDVAEMREGLALRFDAGRHLEDMDDAQAKLLVAKGRVFGGIDFGHWRFGMVLRVVDQAGKIHEIASYFNQRDGLEVRAKALIAICAHYGVPDSLRFRGDAANPTDIVELNNALRRLGSKIRVIAVAQENKARKSSVEKLNDLLDRDALVYRRDVQRYVASLLEVPGTWRLGYNASSAGVEMRESRLLWEIQHWSYPIPQEGVAQKQDPDDNTADGADCIAADRYGIMSIIRPAKKDEDEQDDLNPITPELMAQHAERERKGVWRKQRHGPGAQRPIDPSFGNF